MTVRSASARAKAALLRVRPAGRPDPWGAYLAAVEPALAESPQLHLFARPPQRFDAATRPLPLAVWISGEGEPADRTRAAIEAGTVRPVKVLNGPLAEALTGTRHERFVLVRAGDEPAPLALERLGQAAALAPDAAIVTCDEDELSPAGSRHTPHFRPGPSPDRWLACDDSGGMLTVERARAADLVGSLISDDAWRHELALPLAGPAAAHHVHVPLLLCHRGPNVAEAPPLATEAVARVLRAWEPSARVERTDGVRRVRRPPASEPSVEVIVCFRDRPELLARCITSLFARTEYERLRLALVDNGSTESWTAELVGLFGGLHGVRVIRDDRSFNFAALNNAAVETSTADMLVFLNNDTEVLDGDWISDLVEEALRPEVGAVAPMLLYPDGSVQHAGAALGLHGYAGHPFAGLAPGTETPFGRAAGGTRNWLAVSAACLMVERAKFRAVGGFDESFVVAGNDVDLCLRLTSAGHRSLCVPHVTLLHDESRSRGAYIDPGDFVASERSYGAFRTVGDPFYNPNLTLRTTDCAIRTPDEELQ